MKRWLVRICVLLLLGAAVTEALVFAPMVRGDASEGRLSIVRVRVQRPVEHEWCTYHFHDFAVTRVFSERVRRASSLPLPATAPAGIPTEVLSIIDPPSQAIASPGFENIVVEARGWPFRAMGGAVVLSPEIVPRSIVETRSAWIWPRDQSLSGLRVVDVRFIPLQPLWRGLLMDSVFYAVILWLLFAATFALRRWRRIRRGLCPKCAYPVGTSTVCTECGHPIKTA